MTNTPAPASAPPAPPSKFIMGLVIFLSLVGVGGAIFLFLEGGAEATVQAVNILGFLAPTIAAILAYKGVREVHLAVNSKLDRLLDTTQKLAREEGMEEGRVQQATGTRRVTDPQVRMDDHTGEEAP